MGIQHEEQVPASFADSFAVGFLGDPAVVGGLVGKFCADVEALLNGGAPSPGEFRQKAMELVARNADIFSGRDLAYSIIPGYNNVSLPGKLRADLGEFWTKQRAFWGDDPVAVFFEWLFVHVTESVRRADGDDMLLGVLLGPVVKQAVDTLLGREVRRS